MWNNIYNSIDNYAPKTSNEKKEELTSEVQKLREAWSELKHLWKNLNGTDWQQLENTPKENQKLTKMITEFFDENRDLIEKELGITNISELSPAEATKLTSYITMTKLEYKHAQAITPWKEDTYYENMSEEEQLRYKKDYIVSSYLWQLLKLPWNEKYYIGEWTNWEKVINTHTIKKQSSELYNEIYQSLDKNDINFLNQTNDFSEIKQKAISYLKPTIEKQWITLENWDFYVKWENEEKVKITSIFANFDNWVKEIYVANWKLYSEMSKIDEKPVSEMLENWQGIFRNYAIANEKIFEAIKTMQNSENNQLNNSALVFYSWNSEGNEEIIAASNTEWWTNLHAWNSLITIWEDWKKYIAQIDKSLPYWLKSRKNW